MTDETVFGPMGFPSPHRETLLRQFPAGRVGRWDSLFYIAGARGDDVHAPPTTANLHASYA